MASGPDDLDDVLQFMRVLWEVVHALQKASKRMALELGVTGPQRLVLRVVGLFPGTSAGKLAALLHVHPSTLTGVLQRLADQGLIARSTDAGDRRRSVLRLTPRGVRLNATHAGTVEGDVSRALAAAGPRDRAAARRLLRTVADSLQQQATRPRRRLRAPRAAGAGRSRLPTPS